MFRRLSPTELLSVLIEHVETRTGLRLYDNADGKESPFYSFEGIEREPNDTKTMFMDRFTLSIHCISAPPKGEYSSQQVLDMETALEEALTDELSLPEPFQLVNQECQGIDTVKRDPSNEGHAVVTYIFDVSYGFKCK